LFRHAHRRPIAARVVRAVSDPKVLTAVLAALLNSAVVDQVFRCISGSVAVSAFELEALPLPVPSALTLLAGPRRRPRPSRDGQSRVPAALWRGGG